MNTKEQPPQPVKRCPTCKGIHPGNCPLEVHRAYYQTEFRCPSRLGVFHLVDIVQRTGMCAECHDHHMAALESAF